MVKKRKVRDGVFLHDVYEFEEGDHLKPECWELFFDGSMPEKLLDSIEGQIEAVLSDEKSSERRKHDAGYAAWYLGQVRRNLSENKAADLLVNFHQCMNSLWKAKIRPFEPSMFHRGKLQDNQKKTIVQRREAAQGKHRQWQKMADAIRSESNKKAHWSRAQLAGEILQRLMEQGLDTNLPKVDTIRKKIT
ncbi:MAG: hypothetical protein ACOWWM_12495 [Desulfobacterales bacterium]